MDSIKVIDLFRYPLGVSNLKQDIKELIKFTKEIKRNEKNVSKTNKRGFQSPSNLDKYNKPVFNNLYSNIFKLAGKFSSIYNLQKPIRYGNAWININPQYSYNTAHTSPLLFVLDTFFLEDQKN